MPVLAAHVVRRRNESQVGVLLVERVREALNGGALLDSITEISVNTGRMAVASRIQGATSTIWARKSRALLSAIFTDYIERLVHEYQIMLSSQASVNTDVNGLTGTRYSTRLHGRSGPISLSEFNATPTSSANALAVVQ